MSSITVTIGDHQAGKSLLARALGALEVEHHGDVYDTCGRTRGCLGITDTDVPVVVATFYDDPELLDALSRLAEYEGRTLRVIRFS